MKFIRCEFCGVIIDLLERRKDSDNCIKQEADIIEKVDNEVTDAAEEAVTTDTPDVVEAQN